MEDISVYDIDLPFRATEIKQPVRGKKSGKVSHDSNNNNSNSCHGNLSRTEIRRTSRVKKSHNQGRSSSHSDSSSTSSSCRSYRQKEGVQQPKTESATELRNSTEGHSSCEDSSDLPPLLTPPSSPESIRNGGGAAASDAELALLGHQGLIRVSSSASGHIPRSAVLLKGSSRAVHGARILNVNQGLPTAAVTQRNLTAQAAASE